jgi:xanthine dehydrogenase YagT iron-sulfur-binding subunit
MDDQLAHANDPNRREFLSAVTVGGAAIAATTLAQRPASGAEPATNPAAAAASATMPVVLTINGVDHQMQIDPRISLLDALREMLGMTGSKKGCDHGQCGACTVLVDDRRVNGCLTLAASAAGSRVTTIEGLANGDKLHPVQEAFIKHDAFQCGYCTPGQICSAVGLIAEGRANTPDDIRELMSGNICRCGAYVNIAAAVLEVISNQAAKG